jgi:hypothetical protein
MLPLLVMAIFFGPPAPLPQASVCEVVSDPARYFGKEIRIKQAQFIRADANHASLKDSKCSERSLTVTLPNKFEGQDGLLTMENTNFAGSQKPFLFGDFDGTIVRIAAGASLQLEKAGAITAIYN